MSGDRTGPARRRRPSRVCCLEPCGQLRHLLLKPADALEQPVRVRLTIYDLLCWGRPGLLIHRCHRRGSRSRTNRRGLRRPLALRAGCGVIRRRHLCGYGAAVSHGMPVGLRPGADLGGRRRRHPVIVPGRPPSWHDCPRPAPGTVSGGCRARGRWPVEAPGPPFGERRRQRRIKAAWPARSRPCRRSAVGRRTGTRRRTACGGHRTNAPGPATAQGGARGSGRPLRRG